MSWAGSAPGPLLAPRRGFDHQMITAIEQIAAAASGTEARTIHRSAFGSESPTGRPHSGHRSGEARRSYAQCWHKPTRRRLAVRALVARARQRTADSANPPPTAQYGSTTTNMRMSYWRTLKKPNPASRRPWYSLNWSANVVSPAGAEDHSHLYGTARGRAIARPT